MPASRDFGPIWVFDEATLEKALDSYQREALAAYPHQRERILTTVLALRDLLNSPHADVLRMRPRGTA